MAVQDVPPVPAGAAVRRLNMRRKYTGASRTRPVLDENVVVPGMLDLTRSTATGHVAGWTVYTQRRSGEGIPAVCVRIDSPDGRVLYVAAKASGSATNSRGPASTFFGGYFGLVFSTRTEDQQRRCEAAVTAAFETAWRVADGDGPAVHEQWRVQARIQAAASLMTEDETDQWLSEPRIAGEVKARRLDLTSVGRAHAAGFRPDTALRFYGGAAAMRGLSSARLASDLTFAEAGWTYSDVGTLASWLGVDYRKDPVSTAWAVMTRTQATEAARVGWGSKDARYVAQAYAAGMASADLMRAKQAGLRGRELAAMARGGEVDRAGLRALAALRTDSAV